MVNPSWSLKQEPPKAPFHCRPWMQISGTAATEHKQSYVVLKAMITGGVSGAVELFFAYPLEFLKTQLQFEQKSVVEKLESYNNLGDAAKTTFRKYGLRGFYRGMGVMMVGNIPKAATRFATFEMVRQTIGDNEGRMTNGAKLIGGVTAGVAEAIIAVAPMETIKSKVIHDLNRKTPKYTGSFNSIATILREEGIKGTYQGLLPTILKQSTNQGSRFLLMEGFKDWYTGGDMTATVPTAATLAWAVVASFITVTLNNPIDVVKTRMQGLERKRYKNSLDCLKQIWRYEGFLAFYRGALTRTMRFCIDTTVSFTLFDHIMRLLSKVLP